MSGTAAEIIASLQRPNEQISYVERVYHPALLEPETTSGTMRVDDDGALIRERRLPEFERSEVGEGFIRIWRDPDGEPNLLPIPEQMQTLVRSLRLALGTGVSPDSPPGFQRAEDIEGHWQIELTDRVTEEMTIALTGCGTRVTQLAITEPGGVRRVIEFGG